MRASFLIPIFLFLLFFSSGVDAAAGYSYLGIYVNCVEGRLYWWFFLNQTGLGGMSYGCGSGTTSLYAYNNRMSSNTSYKIGVRVDNATKTKWLKSDPFYPTCSGGTQGNDVCYASGNFYDEILKCDSMSSYVYRPWNSTNFHMQFFPNCTQLFGDYFTKFLGRGQYPYETPNETFAVYLSNDSFLFSFCSDDQAGGDFFSGVCFDTYPSEKKSLVGNYLFVSEYPGCRICNETEKKCGQDLGMTFGDLYVCLNGKWKIERKCKEGGYTNCTVGRVASECPSFSDSILIANKQREPYRVSLTTESNSELIYHDGKYIMYSGQKIKETAFRLLQAKTFSDWYFSDDDDIYLSWSYDSNLTCSIQPGDAFISSDKLIFYNESEVSCTLKPENENGLLTLNILGNITTNSEQKTTEPRINFSFSINVVRDIALLENFQIVKINSTHIALTGRIIKYSDLTDINESLEPSIKISFFINNNETRELFAYGNLNSTNYTNSRYIYEPVEVISEPEVGYFYGAYYVAYANGFSNSTGYVSGQLSPYRVLYFKCQNIPKNVSLDEERTSTQTTSIECRYMLENISAVPISYLSENSSITVSRDLSRVYPEDADFSETKIFSVPFSRTVGYEVVNKENVVYSKYDGMGNKDLIAPGRYVGRFVKLNNPIFYSLTSYLDIVVSSRDHSGFSFEKTNVFFDKSLYYEGEDVLCSANWNDASGLVSGWRVEFIGDRTFWVDSSGTQYPICNSSNSTNECFSVGYSCSSEIGDENRKCMLDVSFRGIQECMKTSQDNSTCFQRKWNFFDGSGTKNLICKVSLFLKGGKEEASNTANAKVNLRTVDFISALFRGMSWWQWLILILFILILVIIVLKSSTR
ncbi:MAG: hypothetical protein ABIM64_01700 [candidate division WOR-3 bacterium]